jgi:hypothetical protein
MGNKQRAEEKKKNKRKHVHRRLSCLSLHVRSSIISHLEKAVNTSQIININPKKAESATAGTNRNSKGSAEGEIDSVRKCNRSQIETL